jgi:polyhydroxyalkanoate synthesis repressor PhaR
VNANDQSAAFDANAESEAQAPRSPRTMILPATAQDVIRIRKYPNRRLYDTSRSTHLTHDEVLAIVRRGLRVQISDSRTEADITNEVLLQILIARAPELVSALPTGALLAVARGSAETVAAAAGAFSQAGDAVRASNGGQTAMPAAQPAMAAARA